MLKRFYDDDKVYKVISPTLEMILDLNPEHELEVFLIPQLFLENAITQLLELKKVDYVTIFEKKGERLQMKLSKCNFSAKIDCLKSMNMIDKDQHKALKLICDLRNSYAHNLLYEVKEEQVMKLLNIGKDSNLFFNLKEINEFLEKYEAKKTYYDLIDLLYTIMISICISFNKKLKPYKKDFGFGYCIEEISTK
jgi:hypothetical protein